MKILGYTAAALIALSAASPAFAQNSTGMTGSAGASSSAQGSTLRDSSSSQNETMQKGSNGQLSPQQNAQMPAGCTPADQSCGDANGNPAVNSPTQKKEFPETGAGGPH